VNWLTDFFHTVTSSKGIESLVTEGGIYALAAIIFSENALLVGFFLPGDSLLITAGILIGSKRVDINFLVLAVVLCFAAIIGESVGYYIGKKAGQTLYRRPNSRFFKREHLMRTHHFYEKHGGKTIILARFIPIIRTFVPVVAGAAGMDLKKFTIFNIVGGIVWIFAGLLAGLILGQTVDNIGDYLYLVIGIVIFLSALPPIIEYFRHRSNVKAALLQENGANRLMKK
jgi:membrane-associated protein